MTNKITVREREKPSLGDGRNWRRDQALVVQRPTGETFHCYECETRLAPLAIRRREDNK